MKVLVIGGGGREHAICWKLKQSPRVTELLCAPGNGGIAQVARCIPEVKATDLEGVLALCRRERVDFVVVAPDDPLALGMVDMLEREGIPAFGPNQSAARMESSKIFSKNLMKKYAIPTAAYETFDDAQAALDYVATAPTPIVIKADGLALGKGVLICEDEQAAVDGVRAIMLDKRFGDSGNHIVVEEFLEGPEVSVLAFTDGKVVKPMVSSMDHKRAGDHDTGLNTGGMGTIAPNPYYTPAVAERCMREIFLPTIAAMNAEGRTFRGCLYFGLMITKDGPKVIEYNCRFGDPETQVVLPLLKSDLLTIMRACEDGTLDQTDVEFSDGAACCVILASGGYPEKYEKGKEIALKGAESASNVQVFHSGTALKDGALVTNGGRVLGVTATADNLGSAIQDAYAAAKKIHFDGMFMRSDIGARAMQALKND